MNKDSWQTTARQRRVFLAEHYRCDLCGAPASQTLVLGYDHLCDTCSEVQARELRLQQADAIKADCAAEPRKLTVYNLSHTGPENLTPLLHYWGFESVTDVVSFMAQRY